MRFLLFSLMVMCFFSGCAIMQDSDDDMQVSAVIRSVHRCSRISPEIEIYNIPKDTMRFEVSLQDRADLSRIHGGGMWNNDESGIIPEGALTRHYMGACPPEGESRSYQYVVKALASDGRVLEENKYIFEQE